MTQLTRRSTLGGLGLAMLPVSRSPAQDGGHTWQSATQLTQTLAAGQVSSRALVDDCIARVEAMDARINAVVVRDFGRAREAADAADAALSRGDRKPLLGLPMTVKEQFNIAGLPTTWGLTRFRNWRPDFDSLVVRRLKDAGAIILGKTNVPEDLSDWQSYNDVYGTTNNPWDVTRTPGGSSGGSAAALAAGFVPLELGSDIGGSLRAPAHFCGVLAHKPSIGLVPQRGAGYPETPPVPLGDDMSVIGPMSRHAADLALALSVIAGPDPLWAGIGYKLDLPPPRHERLADYRVLVIEQHPLVPTDADISRAIANLGDRLAKAGCPVMRGHPLLPDLARTTRVYVELLMAFFGTDMPPARRAEAVEAARGIAPENLSLEAARPRGIAMSHPAWVQTTRIRENLRARWQAMLQDIDVILCPPMSTPAFPHDHAPMLSRTLDVDGKPIRYLDQLAWPSFATINGLPATVMPIGHTASGLPIGVQIIGGYLGDLTTIAFASLVEREWGGFIPPPTFG